MEKISEVQYTNRNGETITVSYDRPQWVVSDPAGEQRFDSVPQWMNYVRGVHGWPLPAKLID